MTTQRAVDSGSSARKIFVEMFGELPPQSNSPYSINDHIEIRSQLEAACFSDVSIETVSKKAVTSSPMNAALSMARAGMLYHEVMNRNPSRLQNFIETLSKEFKNKFGENPMISSMQAVVSCGWKR